METRKNKDSFQQLAQHLTGVRISALWRDSLSDFETLIARHPEWIPMFSDSYFPVVNGENEINVRNPHLEDRHLFIEVQKDNQWQDIALSADRELAKSVCENVFFSIEAGIIHNEERSNEEKQIHWVQEQLDKEQERKNK